MAALADPPWPFGSGIRFGCRAPHLSLEPGYCKARLEAAEHEAPMPDAHPCGTPTDAPAGAAADFAPAYCLAQSRSFNDVQEERPAALEAGCCR